MKNVAINGMGRIGRAAFKIMMNIPDVQVVAVNDLVDAETLAYLLKYDTAYGRLEEHVSCDNNELLAGDARCALFNEKDPSLLPWKDKGVDIVFECTGVFTRKEELEKHLQAGARYVILSAPAKGDGVTTIVHGINKPSSSDRVVSTASCTTNCIAPVCEIMARRIGVEKAIMTTIHAYTGGQKIVDSPSKKKRRGRAGAVNFVPTTTGAAIATTKVLPEYEGTFDGIAVRGPVPVGSLADVVFFASRDTTAEEVNAIFTEESCSAQYENILGVTSDPAVSSDIIKDPRASVVDLGMTQVVGGNLVKVLSWYDNEWGYANQMIRHALEAPV